MHTSPSLKIIIIIIINRAHFFTIDQDRMHYGCEECSDYFFSPKKKSWLHIFIKFNLSVLY
jgi:hypothetical protein